MGPRTRIFRWEFNLLHLRGREKKRWGSEGRFTRFTVGPRLKYLVAQKSGPWLKCEDKKEERKKKNKQSKEKKIRSIEIITRFDLVPSTQIHT